MKSKSKKTILIVDDDKFLIELLEELLVEAGYKVLTAFSGLEALEVYKTHKIEIGVIITDVRMPQGDGIMLLKSIREISKTDTCIILHTGHSELSREEAIKLGATDLLYKPVNFEYLEKYLENLIL